MHSRTLPVGRLSAAGPQRGRQEHDHPHDHEHSGPGRGPGAAAESLLTALEAYGTSGLEIDTLACPHTNMTPNKGPVCVSVINMKGGVGKTTIAAMLCWRAARSGRNILAVDLDPQANLSQALMGDRRYRQFLNDRSPSIVEVFEGYRPPSGNRAAPGPLDVDNVGVRVGARVDIHSGCVSRVTVHSRSGQAGVLRDDRVPVAERFAQ